MTPPELTVVVPTYNEAENVLPLVEALRAALTGLDWEVIFVDDDSPDGTAARARELGRQDPRVRCLHRVGRRGLAGACIEGILASNAPIAVVMDGDLQHDERLLPAMRARILDGADLVIGTRLAEGGSTGQGLSPTRSRGTALATAIARFALRVRVSDPMSGFFMVRRPLFEELAPSLSTEGFKLLLDLLSQAAARGRRLRVEELPFHFRGRQHGESKLDSLVVVQFLALVASRLSGGVLPPRFLLFSAVGLSGVAVHLAALLLLRQGLDFVPAQAGATLVAMTSNFFLNNTFTYQDARLRGARLWRGLLSFYLVCSLGTAANLSVSGLIYERSLSTVGSGLAGAAMSAVFNYAVTKAITWRR